MSKVKSQKIKLTISINHSILKNAKKASSKRNIPISRLVENYLRWFANPSVYCFSCGEKILVANSKICPKCGWLVCPKCKACRCILSEEIASALFHMRKTFEELLGGRIKP